MSGQKTPDNKPRSLKSLFDAQVKHLKQHQGAFDQLHGGPRDIRQYFDDYAYERAAENNDLYLAVCQDLEIKPDPSLVYKKLSALARNTRI